mgnify:FL=1
MNDNPRSVTLRLHTPGVLEAQRQQVISAFAGPETHRAIAKRFNVSVPGISAFRRRHLAEIAEAKSAVRERIADVALREKAVRIRHLAWLVEGMEAELRQRGFMWPEPYGADREVLRPPVGLVRELRATIRHIAEELGEIPDTGTNSSSDNRIMVLVRNYNFNVDAID